MERHSALIPVGAGDGDTYIVDEGYLRRHIHRLERENAVMEEQLKRFMEIEPPRADQTPYVMAVYDKGREVLAQQQGGEGEV